MAELVNQPFALAKTPAQQWSLFDEYSGALFVENVAVTFKEDNFVATTRSITMKDGSAVAKLTAAATLNDGPDKLATADVVVSFTCHFGSGRYHVGQYGVELTNIKWATVMINNQEKKEKDAISGKLKSTLEEKLKKKMEEKLIPKRDDEKCGSGSIY